MKTLFFLILAPSLVIAQSGASQVGLQTTGGDVKTNVQAAMNSAFLYDIGYTTLAKACTAASSNSKTLMLTKAWTGLTTQSLACNKYALTGGKLQPASGQTVTLSGSFDGDLTQHFDTSAGGTITAVAPFKVAAMYPQWWGATGNGRTVTDGVMSPSSATLTSATASFTGADVGRYVSVSGCGASTTFPSTYNGGLGTTIASVTNSTTATLSVACNSTGTSGATVTIGTNDYQALIDTAKSASWPGVGSVIFPAGMYVIGQHKTQADSCTSSAYDILWTGINGVKISGPGGGTSGTASIYIDGSFSQAASTCTGNASKSSTNAVTPFYVIGSTGWSIEGITIIGNKDLTTRTSGVTQECLTCYAIASNSGGSTGNTNYSIRRVYASGLQTDCFEIGNSSVVSDQNSVLQNVSCSQPGRGNFSIANAQNVHLSSIAASNACLGNYGGFQPCHGVDIEPNLTADNIVIDGGSNFSNDLGWEVTVADPTKTSHVTVKDSKFSWNTSGKTQGFNVNSALSVIDNNTFTIGLSASTHNIQTIVGTTSLGYTNQIWSNNVFTDNTNLLGSKALFDTGSLTDGTLQNLDVINNTFRLNGLGISGRNIRRFSGNSVYWTAVGGESSTAAINFEGSQNISGNNYNTNAASGALKNIYSSGAGWTIPIVSNEQYLNLASYTYTCTFCSFTASASGGGTLLFLTPPSSNLISNSSFANTCAGWTFDTGASCGSGVATFSSVSSNGVYQSVTPSVLNAPCQMSYTISGYSAGTFTAFGPGGIAGTGRSANGTYYENMTPAASGSFGVRGGGSATGNVSNIRLYCQN